MILLSLTEMGVQCAAMGITVKFDRKNPLDELRRTSGAERRPPAILVTFDFETNDTRESPYRQELIEYLEKTLGGVMVTQSCYAIPHDSAVSGIIARIGSITHDSSTVYAFPIQNWDGHGNAAADEWFRQHELPSLP